MTEVERILRQKYCPHTLVQDATPVVASVVSKAADIPSLQLVMSVDEFTEEEISKACGEFNKANPLYMNHSYTLLADWTLPTGHVLKAKSWVLRLDNL